MNPLRTTQSTPAKSAASNRRLDIQGLRAVAVIAVIAFHSGLPLNGGFAGVDVFFVISGFVITAMLMREHAEHGRVRFARFYIRRFKRLTPALSVTVAIVMIVSTLLISPLGPQATTATTGLGAMLLVANFAIVASSGGGYFAPASNLNPLLHTWSLSIEEQFYLVFPILLVLAIAYGHKQARLSTGRSALIMVTLLCAASIVFVIFNDLELKFPGSSAITGFYSPFARAWEFGAGALIAIIPIHRWKLLARHSSLLGTLGATLLLITFLLIKGDNHWPGILTVVPVIGTILVIVGGSHDASPRGTITTLLSHRYLTKVGDWSYSLYLWHWPIIVFSHQLWPASPWVGIPAAVISVLPAFLSYRFIEEPARHANGLAGRKLAKAVSVAFLCPLVIASTVQAGNYFHWGSERISTVFFDISPQHLGDKNNCSSRTPLGGQPKGCSWNTQATGDQYIYWATRTWITSWKVGTLLQSATIAP